MNSVFPTGLPFATAFYLTLYVLTWALHWAFMHYVAAGTLWLAAAAGMEAFGGRLWQRPATRTLLSWLPFMLSAAVTAGVAPLLFMQILYGVPFYTANLLLNWIWMLIVPALIALFYLMYLLQAYRDREGFTWLRIPFAFAAVGCVVLTGGLWSTNHLLANTGLANWTAVFVGEGVRFDWPNILARGCVWLGFAFPGMAMIAAWQLIGAESRTDFSPSVPQASDGEDAEPPSARSLGTAAIGGIALIGLGCWLVFGQAAATARETIMGPFALPYLFAFGIGLIAQLAAWGFLAATGRWQWAVLAAATAGYVISLLSIAVLREAIRLSILGYEQFQETHRRAGEVEGFGVFLFFAALNVGLIGLCIWLVVRYAGEKPVSEPEKVAATEGTEK